MLYINRLFCQNLFSTLSAANIHYYVLWLWHFLKSVSPHWQFEADSETLTPPRHRVSHLHSMGQWTSIVVLLQSKKCNIRLPYAKHTLNIWIEHHTFNVSFLPSVIHAFWKTCVERMVWETCILPSLEKPYAYILQPMHQISFSRNLRLRQVLVNVCYTKRPFYVRYLTYVNVREWMYVKHALLDLHVYHALNVRLTCIYQNACFTHGAHFPVYKCNSNCEFILLYFTI